ncbi:hypothetical protein RQP46_010801 [Phenoliferia psychrophenolica]
MLSSNISMDSTFLNKSWQVVGQGLFSLREVNTMERELFALLGRNVTVRDEELISGIKDVVEPHGLSREATADVNLLDDSWGTRDAPVLQSQPSQPLTLICQKFRRKA